MATTHKRSEFLAWGMALSIAVFGQSGSLAQDKKPDNSAIKPVPKDKKRHEGFVELAKKGGIDLLFLGDSITDGWRGPAGEEAWKKHFQPLHAANFGIGGDRTQHVLWRIENGELDGIHPKVAVMMIGTNNLSSNTAEQIAQGITAIVKEIHKRQPKTKVLLLGIFPRSQKATDPLRDKIKDINKIIAKLDDRGKTVFYLDIGEKFMDMSGDISKEIMPDYLHLSKAGYKIWAEAIQSAVDELMH
jgi:lysophospholipase L1-like esterase